MVSKKSSQFVRSAIMKLGVNILSVLELVMNATIHSGRAHGRLLDSEGEPVNRSVG